jgi:NhaA family Na+:H+ antiporter
VKQEAAQPKAPAYRFLRPFRDFIQHSASGGIVLIAATLLALVLANSPLAHGYEAVLEWKIGPTIGTIDLHYDVLRWINDGLMVIFFLLVGLEIKREVLTGELSNRHAALLPVASAFGGAIVPAILYAVFNHGLISGSGWGIPMATDIAFTLGLLALLGSRVPPALKIFVAAAAIVDDLIAIIVIALFYSNGINGWALGVALAVFVMMLAGNRLGIQKLAFYLVLGFALWLALLQSGIHATIAGVLIALAIPTHSKASASHRHEESSPLHRLEHALQPWVAFGIMPIFALANAAIPLRFDHFDSASTPLIVGIGLGLVLGKPVGILCACVLAIRSGVARLPHGVHWNHLIGAACLGGIGFTMSLFIAALAVHDSLLEIAKLSILTSSLIAGSLGFMLIRRLPAAG